jgi:hypothetical protein
VLVARVERPSAKAPAAEALEEGTMKTGRDDWLAGLGAAGWTDSVPQGGTRAPTAAPARARPGARFTAAAERVAVPGTTMTSPRLPPLRVCARP